MSQPAPQKILIINGHQPYPFSEGRLNAAIADRMRAYFEDRGDTVRVTEVAKGYDASTEADSHVWADTVILQYPVNWMGVPWSLKKYQDEVYTAGMDGRLCTDDGRTPDAPKANYGRGGTRGDTRYMLSVTFNAPKEAFDAPAEYLAEGRSVDDLLRPTHMNFRFFGMTALPSFAAYDVMKNPEIARDFARLDDHLHSVFG